MACMDGDLLRHALETARRHGFATVRLEVGDHQFKARTGAFGDDGGTETTEAPVADPGPPQPVPIESPCVGYFRAATPALHEGDSVTQGDVVGSVIALGLASEVASPSTGIVTSILVTEDQPVEFGETMMTVAPE